MTQPEPASPSDTGGFRHVILDDVGSTNTEAFARAAAGEPGPLWIMARRQTMGRGRSGRSWTSDPGNLYASLLQRLRCPPAALAQVSLLAGVAVLDAIAHVAGSTPLHGLRLKWPNDVLIGEAKCVGILPESQQLTQHVSRHAGQQGERSDEVILVVGIGINLSSHPEHIGRAATHLAAHGLAIAPETMLAALAARMDHWLQVWNASAGFSSVREAWLERAGEIGEMVSVNTGGEMLSGAFLGLDATGAMLLADADGLERRVTFGDVSLGSAGGVPGR